MSDNITEKPIISIIVPCYNSEWCIDRCVNSIVNQTLGFEKLQLILVNDASTDGTLDKLTEWEQKYPDNITGKFTNKKVIVQNYQKKGAFLSIVLVMLVKMVFQGQ